MKLLLGTSPRPRELLHRYRAVRAQTTAFSAMLSDEDQGLQSMPDASPTKWHLAHTTWFFETLVLAGRLPGYSDFHPRFRYLFNSYYNSVGPQFERARRGLLSRPTLREVHAYREHVDRAMTRLLASPLDPEAAALVELGLHHEQQHQELAVTDVKHALSLNPLAPAVVSHELGAAEVDNPGSRPALSPLRFRELPEAVYEIGNDRNGFCFDNETPRHRQLLQSFSIATRPVSVGEYLAFVEQGGYREPSLWLSDGWAWLAAEGVELPLYWNKVADGFGHYTLAGYREVDLDEPACHLSYYEADAYARWAGARLPTEAEWEVALSDADVEGADVLDLGRLHPRPLRDDVGLGGVWEWTASPYSAYPGYKPPTGTVGEYNGKFMCNQMVLRGGSCASPAGHIRPSYRNFFPPGARWQFSGVRLAC